MGSLNSGGSLDHLRFEVEVAAAHAARRPDSAVAADRLRSRRAELRAAECAAALAGFLSAVPN